VTYVYNLSFSEGSWFETSLPTKTVSEITSQQKVGCGGACLSSSYMGSISRRIEVQAGLGKNERPYLKNKA
jgi:hypothetical protein